MPRSDGIDELDPRFPIRLSQTSPVFWRLIKHPPVKAAWRPHVDFAVDETLRALTADAAPSEAFVVPYDGTAPLPVVTVPRTYPELEEDTLAHEFTEADRHRLAVALSGAEYLA